MLRPARAGRLAIVVGLGIAAAAGAAARRDREGDRAIVAPLDVRRRREEELRAGVASLAAPPGTLMEAPSLGARDQATGR